MVLWWGAIGLFVLTIVPTVVVIANGIISQGRQIKRYAADVSRHGASIADNVGSVSELSRARDLVKDTVGAAQRLGSSLPTLLPKAES